MRALSVAALLWVGCSFDGRPPPGLIVQCDREDQCPADLGCDLASHTCVSLRRPFAGPPTLRPTAGRAGDTFTVDFTLDRPASSTPTVQGISTSGASVSFSPTVQNGAVWQFQYTATGQEPEGPLQLRLDATLDDGSALRRVDLGVARLDFSPPQVLSAALAYHAGPENPLTRLGLLSQLAALRQGNWADLSLALDEASREPTLEAVAPDAGSPGLVVKLLSGAASTWAWRIELPEGPVADGTWPVFANVADEVGNQSRVPLRLAPPLDVLTHTPGAPHVELEGKIVFHVVPYGTRARPAPYLSVEGAAGAVDGQGVLWAFYDNFSLGSIPVGQGAAQPDGTVPEFFLTTTLSSLVDLAFVDRAGNVSESVGVRDVHRVTTAPTDGGAPSGLGFVGAFSPNRIDSPTAGPSADLSVTGTGRTVTATWPVSFLEPSFPYHQWYELESKLYEGSRGLCSTVRPMSVRGITVPCTVTPPSNTVGQAVAFDALRGQQVTFGGLQTQGSLNIVLDTTFPSAPDAGPGARYQAAMAFVPPLKAVVLHGGRNVSVYDDTWLLDTSGWRRIASGGPPRHGHTLTWDPARGELIMVGGEDESAMARADTWAFTDAGWQQRASSGPPPRKLHSVYYSPLDRRLVLTGGLGGAQLMADTWVWSGSAWSELDAGSYGARARHGSAFWSAAGVGVLAGGVRPASDGGSELIDEVWSFDGVRWVHETAGAPGTPWFADAGAAWDPTRGAVVLTGGAVVRAPPGCASPFCRVNAPNDNTWELRDAGWVPLGAPGTALDVTARFNPALTFDPTRGAMLLAGGRNTSGQQVDVLELDGGAWAASSVPPVTVRQSCPGFAMAYDPPSRGLVVAGGQGAAGCSTAFHLTGGQWLPFGEGPLGAVSRLIFSPALRGLVFLGGGTNAMVLGSSWQSIGALPSTAWALSYDSERGAAIAFGQSVFSALPVMELLPEGPAREPSGGGDLDRLELAVYDEGRRAHVLVPSDAPPVMVMPRLGRPALIAAPGYPGFTGAVTRKLRLALIAGGDGSDWADAPQSGVIVWQSWRGHWVPKVTSPAALSAPVPLELTLDDPELLQEMSQASAWPFAVSTSGLSGRGRAALRVSHVEVEAWYRLP